MFMWIFKSVHRKKVGMLFLCLVSIAAMTWVFSVGKYDIKALRLITAIKTPYLSDGRFEESNNEKSEETGEGFGLQCHGKRIICCGYCEPCFEDVQTLSGKGTKGSNYIGGRKGTNQPAN